MRKELQIISEEDLQGDPNDISEFFVQLREKWLERGYRSLYIERYWGDRSGYLQLTGEDKEDEFEDMWGMNEMDVGEED